MKCRLAEPRGLKLQQKELQLQHVFVCTQAFLLTLHQLATCKQWTMIPITCSGVHGKFPVTLIGRVPRLYVISNTPLGVYFY